MKPGPNDEIGRLNLMTNETQLNVLPRIKSGKIYDLSVDYYVGMPSWFAIGDPRYQYWLTHSPHGTTVDDPMGLASAEDAFGRLRAFLARRGASSEAVDDMEGFERELHEYFMAAEREVLAEELGRLDVDLPAVTIGGKLCRRVVRCEETYVSAAGPVRVMRTLYRGGHAEERALCPLELRAGVVEGRWTPLAARQVAFVVAHLTPQEGEDLFRELGNMTPSKSSLDGCPSSLGRVGRGNGCALKRCCVPKRRCPRKPLR